MRSFRHGFSGLAWLWLILLSACAPPGTRPSNLYEAPNYYFSTMRTLLLDVAYEPGAEPYTGTGVGGRPIWDFVEENLNALFDGRPNSVAILVPKEIEQMSQIPRQGRQSYRTEDLLELAKAMRRYRSSATRGAFFVVFLNGYYEQGSEVKPSVLGVSVSGTTVIAIFKPVIEASMTDGDPFVPKYVEQSTIVHEMGHALGLVDNGLPAVSPHRDVAHGAHCTNPHCVMYWLHEGAADLRDFVSRFIQTRQLVVFDDACLQDALRYRPGTSNQRSDFAAVPFFDRALTFTHSVDARFAMSLPAFLFDSFVRK